MQYFLGVDGGATKTKAVLIDKNKKIIGRGEDNGSNLNVTSAKNALENIQRATRRALFKKTLEVSHACFALAGVNTQIDRKIWQNLLQKSPYFRNLLSQPPLVVNDIEAALRSVPDKNAIATIAGTGSNCAGRNRQAETAQSGGVDYILGDQGSAYAIGLQILQAITGDLDGRGPKTKLTNLFFDQFKIRTLEELQMLVYQKPWDKTDIAKVAPLAEIAAQKGDQVAGLIIKEAARQLALMICAVAQKLNLIKKDYSIVTTGSVFKIPRILYALKKEILRLSPKAHFVNPQFDSATAAAYLALDNYRQSV